MNKLTFAGFALGALILPIQAANGENSAEFFKKAFACSNEADCVVAPDPCGWPAALNRKMLQEYRIWVNRVSPVVECNSQLSDCVPNSESFLYSLRPSCQEGKCSVSFDVPESGGENCPEKFSAFNGSK